jgi:hypothetical protein
MTTKRKGWFIPPTKGLLEPVESPTPHPAREAMGLLWHIPQQEQRKPKRKSNAVKVDHEWKPEHDLSPEVLAAFKPRR